MVVPSIQTYHFPPEVLQLAVDALTRVNRGKKDLIIWLRSAGVADGMLRPWMTKLQVDKESVRKAEVARDILCRLNEGGDRYLAQRREILKRLTETEDFSACWEDDRLEAQGLVARLREIVGIKDTFTRFKQETQHEAARRRLEQDRRLEEERDRRQRLKGVHDGLAALVTFQGTPQERGRRFEQNLTTLFASSQIQVMEPFRTNNEQIDGAVHLDGHTCLVEARWWAEPLQHKDVADFFVKLSTRSSGTRGVFISASSFTRGCEDQCVRTNMAVVFVTLEDILLCLEAEQPIAEMLGRKYERLSTQRRINVGFRELL